jgi:5-methylcytosine-specific restriction endonuclease McrA
MSIIFKHKAERSDHSIVGKVFGELTVDRLSHTKPRNGGGTNSYWILKCPHGHERVLKRSNISAKTGLACLECKRSRKAQEIQAQVEQSKEKDNSHWLKIWKSRVGDYGNITLLGVTLPKIRKFRFDLYIRCNPCGSFKVVDPEWWKTQRNKNSLESWNCGCNSNKRNTTDCLGLEFGRLTIESIFWDGSKKSGEYRTAIKWAECRCSCGGFRTVRVQDLREGKYWRCKVCRPEPKRRLEDLDLTKISQKRFMAPDYSAWVKAIRSTGECKVCGSTEELHAHHLESIQANPHRITDLTNGVCLCASCHIDFHKAFGKATTEAQFEKFFSDRCRQLTTR